MELGNIVFGNSRGKFELDRDWEEIFCQIYDILGIESHDHYENDTFKIFPYYWGECNCGFEQETEWYDSNNHKSHCFLVLPNFIYKPTNFQIKWYKYPLRDAYMNQNIDCDEFTIMINDCISGIINETKKTKRENKN